MTNLPRTPRKVLVTMTNLPCAPREVQERSQEGQGGLEYLCTQWFGTPSWLMKLQEQKMQSSASIFRVPNEIFDLIIGHICPDYLSPQSQSNVQSQRALAGLAQTCRSLHRVMAPRLYAFNRDFLASSAVTWAARVGNLGTLETAAVYGLDLEVAHGRLAEPVTPESIACKEPTSHPIYHAVLHGQHDVVAWFLDRGADANTAPGPGQSELGLLDTALANGNESIATLLLDRGARAETIGIGRIKYSISMHLAVERGLCSMVERLVGLPGVDVENRSTKKGLTALAFAASDGSRQAVLRKLLDLGADVNGMAKKWRDTPLSRALRSDQLSNAAILLKAGAKFEVEHDPTRAVGNWLQLLSEKGRFWADPDRESWLMASFPSPVEKGEEGNGPPSLAVPAKKMPPRSILDMLLRAGADVYATDLIMAGNMFNRSHTSAEIEVLLKRGHRIHRAPLEEAASLCQGSISNTRRLKSLLGLASDRTVRNGDLDAVLRVTMEQGNYAAGMALLRYRMRVTPEMLLVDERTTYPNWLGQTTDRDLKIYLKDGIFKTWAEELAKGLEKSAPV